MSNYNEQLIINYIAESNTIADVLRKIDLDPRGRNYKIIHDIINKFNLNTSHFLGKAHCKNTKGISIPWNEVLTENSEFILTPERKNRLIKEGLLFNKCYKCDLTNWLGNIITLQIDHINGKNNDNRLENLRLLCPNCHSQTSTYAGRNNKGKKILKKRNRQNHCKCEKLKGIHNDLCRSCYQQYKSENLTKITWPTIEELLVMTKEIGFVQTGKKLGVSDNAVRKRIKSRLNSPDES